MDVIWGQVIEVIDGDTFEVDVTDESDANKYDYDEQETVRIRGVDAPELPDQQGRLAKEYLENRILGYEVELHVHARDAYRRLVADVLVCE